MSTIGDSAFQDCVNLKSIILPDTIKTIDVFAFDCCTSLENVNIPNGVTTIGERAFYYCPIKDLTLPDTVTTIGEISFSDCDITSLTIPKSVENIGFSAFFNNPLTDIFYMGSEEEWNEINIVGNLIVDGISIHYNQEPATKEELMNKIGDIDTALDEIIALQNAIIGGE